MCKYCRGNKFFTQLHCKNRLRNDSYKNLKIGDSYEEIYAYPGGQPLHGGGRWCRRQGASCKDRRPDRYVRYLRLHGRARFSGGGRSEEHTSELQSLMRISYAVFCLKKKRQQTND